MLQSIVNLQDILEKIKNIKYVVQRPLDPFGLTIHEVVGITGIRTKSPNSRAFHIDYTYKLLGEDRVYVSHRGAYSGIDGFFEDLDSARLFIEIKKNIGD